MSSGEPTRPSNVSAARRSSWPGSTATGTGRNTADPHLGRERARENPSEHRLRRLRGRMRSERRPRLVPGDVLDHHHTAARLAQRRGGGLGDEEAPLRGCAEGRVPVRFVELLERLGREALAGGVHEQIESAQLLDGAFDERSRLAWPRDVAVGAAGGENRPALALEPAHDRLADAAHAAGDQRPHAASHSTPQGSSIPGVCWLER